MINPGVRLGTRQHKMVLNYLGHSEAGSWARKVEYYSVMTTTLVFFYNKLVFNLGFILVLGS